MSRDFHFMVVKVLDVKSGSKSDNGTHRRDATAGARRLGKPIKT